MLALVAAPAPLFHDNFLARGTWLAGRITELWGDPRYASATAHHHDESPLFEMGQQVLAGIAIYVPLTWLGLMLARTPVSRGGAAARRPAAATPATATSP